LITSTVAIMRRLLRAVVVVAVIIASADLVVGRGATPLLTWEPWNSAAGVNQPTYRLSAIANGTHDALVRRWATQIKAWGKPLMLRFAHEMNGNWYPWSEGVNGNAAGQYVPAYRRVVTLFRSVGVTNVTWVWSPNVANRLRRGRRR